MDKPIVPREIRTIYEGKIFKVQIETIELPKGGELRAEIVRHPGSVVIVPLTDTGSILLVRQYRHAIGRWVWELPAGSLKHGEDPDAAAQRECHEETGRIPGNLEALGSFYPTPGYCDEQMHIYRATALRLPNTEDEAAQPDDDEDLEVEAFTVGEIRRLMATGDIIDLKTVAALTLLR